MGRSTALRALATLAVMVLAAATSAADSGSRAAPGWTGESRPAEVIHARLELMEHIEELMEPLDTITIQTGAVREPQRLRQSAEVIGAMLRALPHLFPPTTNLYDPKALEPKTIALPRIWAEFDTFYAMAEASARAADHLAEAQGDEPLRVASRALRGTCDGCHALYLRKYVSPVVLPADLEFDFERAIGAPR